MVRVLKKFNFTVGYVTKADPKENYGEPFKVHYVLEISDNKFIAHLLQVHSSISSQTHFKTMIPLKDGFLVSNYLEHRKKIEKKAFAVLTDNFI
jgi:hypothetical protein